MTNSKRARPRPLSSLLFAGAALLAIAYAGQWLSGEAGEEIPALALIEPSGGDTLRNSLVIRFRTDAPLRLTPHGWAAGDLHPHARLGGTEHMPAADDIRSLGGGVSSWRLPPPTPGIHTLRLGWAGPDHRPRGTQGPAVRFRFE